LIKAAAFFGKAAAFATLPRVFSQSPRDTATDFPDRRCGAPARFGCADGFAPEVCVRQISAGFRRLCSGHFPETHRIVENIGPYIKKIKKTQINGAYR
jgi:hypothetical protein